MPESPSLTRAALVVTLPAVLLAATSRSRAADPPRRDFYAQFAVGPTFVSGKVDYASTTSSFYDSFSGAGADVRFAAGYAPDRSPRGVSPRVRTRRRSIDRVGLRLPKASFGY